MGTATTYIDVRISHNRTVQIFNHILSQALKLSLMNTRETLNRVISNIT
jgi:hypothetical protein